jgi:uncharacterized protein YbaR (Trm112 family)
MTTNTNDYICCPACNKKFKAITLRHVNTHGFDCCEDFKRHYKLEYLVPPSKLEFLRKLKKDNEEKRWLANKKRMLTNNPMSGKNHSEESIKLMSDNRMGKGIGLCGKYERTSEIRNNISKSVCDAFPNYLFGKSNKIIHLEKAGGNIIIRSSWEERIVRALNNHPFVTVIKMEPFVLPYSFNGEIKRYIPDLYFEIQDCIPEIWEIKHPGLIKDERWPHKLIALQNFINKMEYNYRIISSLDEIVEIERIVNIIKQKYENIND